jgi:hypothetical protein
MTDLRAAPLTEAETRAGLWAIRRVLDLARAADPAEIDDVLAAAGCLPEHMLRPAGFPGHFRDTLAGLASRHHDFDPVLAEFDRLTGRNGRNGRKGWPRDLDDDPWRDCGAAD